MKNSKTDSVDANTLAEYGERMAFVAWTRPSNEKISLRSLARRIHSLSKQKAAAKNHLHALTATTAPPQSRAKRCQSCHQPVRKTHRQPNNGGIALDSQTP